MTWLMDAAARTLQCRWVLLFICLTSLVSCTTQSSVPPHTEAAPTMVLASPTHTEEPTAVSVPTATAVPFPSPSAPLVWAETAKPIVLSNYSAQWSPTANELLLDTCPDMVAHKSAVYRAGAPDFEPVLLNEADVECSAVSRGATWTPDGQSIIFSGRELQDSGPDITSVWLIGRDGSNPHPVRPDENTGLYVEFLGWMGESTLAYESYAGGGHRILRVLDVFTEARKAYVLMQGVFHDPTTDYVAGTYWAPNPVPVAVSLSPDYENAAHFVLGGAEYVRFTPLNTTRDEWFNNAEFEGWRGGTSQMLIQSVNHWVEDDFYRRVTRLKQWEVEADNTVVVAEGGVDGQFSPDGDMLTYLTLGPPWLDSEDKPLVDNYQPIPLDGTQYLNLLDMSAQVVTYSVPILEHQTLLGYRDRPDDILYELQVSFSPNSQYLTYFSPGDGTAAELNVLDLDSLQIVYSALADTQTPVWSPDSSRVVYYDHQMGLGVLRMSTLTFTPLVQSGSQRIVNIQWSYDGQYLSLDTRAEGESQFLPDTAILRVVDGVTEKDAGRFIRWDGVEMPW